MFKELIDKLKVRKQRLEGFRTTDVVCEIKQVKDNNFNITISKIDDIFRIEISDYISISDYVDEMKSCDEYSVLDLICNSVLWNSNMQKINKGVYYVIIIDKSIYNILFTEGKIKINERIKKKLDKQRNKENITEERLITIDMHKEEYDYYSAKHESDGNTYYTKYYTRNKICYLKELYLKQEEAYEEISSIIYNLENINGIENILDVKFLKEHILNILREECLKKKKTL